MGVEASPGARQGSLVVAELDDEPAKTAPRGTVGKGSSAPSGLPPPAQPNSQRAPSAPQIPKLPLNPDGTIKGGNKALVTALLSKNAGIFFGDEHGTIEVVDTFSGLLPTLKASGVRVLFVEIVPSTDPILEKFQKDGDAKALKAHLIELGWDIGADGKWIDHLVNMLAETRKNGIKLCGIDEETDSRRLSPDDRLERANVHWAWAIRETLAKQPKNEKYVVFGGLGHSKNSSGNKGIEVLLGIPSITPYLASELKRDQALHKDSPTIPMTMAKGAVTRNPHPDQSDFIWKAQ